MRGVHGIFCVYVGVEIGLLLTDLFPSGKFLTDLNQVMLLLQYDWSFVICILMIVDR